MTNPKSPNAARELLAAVREAALPMAQKALLRAVADSFHAASGAAAPSKARLMAAMGSDVDEAAFTAARQALLDANLLDVVRRPKDPAGNPQTSLYIPKLDAIRACAGEIRAGRQRSAS